MDSYVEIAKTYGGPGLLLLCMGSYVLYLHKIYSKAAEEHREERQEWREESKQMHSEALSSLNKNSTILSELSTVIRSSRR